MFGNRNLKTLVIEPLKQLKLGTYIIALSVIFAVIIAAVFVFVFIEQYQHVMELFKVVNPEAKYQMLTNDIFSKNAIRLGLILLGFIGLTLFTVFSVTHKYYGPIVAINRFVKAISEGDYSQRVVLRKQDELQDLAAKLNHMAESIEKRHGSSSEKTKNAQ